MLFIRLATLLPTLSLAISCSSDFEQLPKTGFAPQELQEWGKPFTAIWTDPNLKRQKIPNQKSFIKPISTAWLDQKQISDSKRKAIDKLTLYFDQQLADQIKNNTVTKAKIVNDPKKARFFIEPALVQVEPTLYGWNFLSFGTSLFVPMISYAFNPFTHGEMTMVIKVSDTKTRKVYVVMADHKEDEPTIFGSIRDFTPYGHHFRTMDMWAEKLTDLLASKPGEEIKKPLWITLNPF